MNSKVSKYLIRIVLILLGLSVVGVTLFLFLYVFWKGKTVMSLSFIFGQACRCTNRNFRWNFPGSYGISLSRCTCRTDWRNPWNRCFRIPCFLPWKQICVRHCKFCNHRTVRYPVYFIWPGGLHTPDLWFWHQPESFVCITLRLCHDCAICCNPRPQSL